MKKSRHVELLVLLASLLLTSCGGGGSGTVAPQASNGTPPTVNDPGAPAQDAETAPESSLFPAAGSLVDPASTREEIASRADTLLVEYGIFLPEALRQMGVIYQTLQSGSESSTDPDILAMDLQFFGELNRGGSCVPTIDPDGILVGVTSCRRSTASFTLRHPRYEDTIVRVEDYMPGIDVNAGDVSSMDLSSTRINGPAGIVPASSLRMETEINYLGVPTLYLYYPAYVGTRCAAHLSPTRFEDSLNINECAEIFQTAITVFQRLNNR